MVGDYCEEQISLHALVEMLACQYYIQSFTPRCLAVSACNIREGAAGKGNCTVVLDRYAILVVICRVQRMRHIVSANVRILQIVS